MKLSERIRDIHAKVQNAVTNSHGDRLVAGEMLVNQLPALLHELYTATVEAEAIEKRLPAEDMS